MVSQMLNDRVGVAISSGSSSFAPPNARRDSNRAAFGPSRARVSAGRGRKGETAYRGGDPERSEGEDPRRLHLGANLLIPARRAVGRGRGWRRLRPARPPRQDDR